MPSSKPRPKSLGTMKPKRKVVKADKDTSLTEFAATFGSPNSPGPIHEYVREAKAKERALEALNDRRAWLTRVNPNGLADLDAAINEVQQMPPLTQEPFVVTCLLDESSGLTTQIRLWKK